MYSQRKGVESKMRKRRLISGVNLRGVLKQKMVKTGVKQDVRVPLRAAVNGGTVSRFDCSVHFLLFF